MIRARVIGDAGLLRHEHPYTFVLGGAGAVTLFESHCLLRRRDDVLIAMPGEVRQTGFRESPRVSLPGTASTGIVVDHPRLSGARIEEPLFDVAGRGVSFPVDADGHALFPGDRLSGLRVTLPDGSIEAMGVVRSLASRRSGNRLSCGVELVDFAGREDRHRWHRFVFRHTHPDLRDSHGRAATAWNVLEASKYIDLWTPPQHRERIRHQFLRSWDAPANEVGHKMVLHKDRTPVGVSAGSVAYPGTWILHHLGIAPGGEGRDAHQAMQHASELIAGLLYRLRDMADLEHFVIYAERGKRWNDRLYGDFAARYADEDKLLCTPSRVYRRLADTALPAATSEELEIEVQLSTPALLAKLASHLRQVLPAAELRAYALDEERIDLTSFSSECARHGYERTREVFFAFEKAEPVAAMLVETGSEGVNVFGLLNACRMFWLGPPPANAAAIRLRLLRDAVTYYRAAGKKSFLAFQDEHETAHENPHDIRLRANLTGAAPAGSPGRHPRVGWVPQGAAVFGPRRPAPGLRRCARPLPLIRGASGFAVIGKPGHATMVNESDQRVQVGGHDPAALPMDGEGLSKPEYLDIRTRLNFRASALPTLAIVAFDAVLVYFWARLVQQDSIGAFVVSQVMLAVLFFNAFSLLHECGHGNVAPWPAVNALLGHVASLLCFIPYFPWKYIHQQHHAWTGNLDKDPVLKSLRRFRDRGVPLLVRICWLLWIPMAALLQHVVYLSYPWQMARRGELTRGRLVRSLTSLLWLPVGYLLLWLMAPALVAPRNFILGFALFLVLEELVNVPHHLDMPVFDVKLPLWQQHRATRSCYYPRGVSELLVLNFNFHTEHHLFPTLPWYRLRGARDLVRVALASRYHECRGIEFNVHNRTRDFDAIVERYRTNRGAKAS